MKKNSAAGLTLLELMVSITISGIVIAAVFSTWNYLNRHTHYQENRVALRNETARIADEITLKLRRTSGVLWFTRNSVRLLDPNPNSNTDGGDTLEYAFDGEYLTRNGVPIYFGVTGGAITSFELKNAGVGVNDNVDDNGHDSKYLLIEVTISAGDGRSNRDTCRFVVNVNVRGRDNAVFSERWDL